MLEGSGASFGSLVFRLVFAVVLLCLATVVAINKLKEISFGSVSPTTSSGGSRILKRGVRSITRLKCT